MAYNQPYDPDALPRFAEPEPARARSLMTGSPGKKHGSAPSQQQQQQQQQYHQPQHRPPQHHQSLHSQYGQHPPQHHQPVRHNTASQAQRLEPQQQHPRYDQQAQQQHQQQQQRFHESKTPVQSHAMFAASPPPVASGQHPAPPGRPASSRPPPSPQSDQGGADPALVPLFRAVDKDGTGFLSEKELSVALVNGDWTAFDIQTVRMMIRMFDSDRNGTIGFEEFCGIWSFLASWRTLFDRFDVDRSGNISFGEFSNALVAFRYRLSPGFVELLFRTYDKRGEGVMSFDLFVQACISLKRMTDVFKKYDTDRDGYITLSFEDFLSEILKQLR